jgi:phosphopantetheine adenylyltransferase
MLHIGGRKGALTEAVLSKIAQSLSNNSKFEKLAIPYGFGSTTADHLSREVNEARKRNGLPPIKIKCEYTVCCVDVSYQFAVFYTYVSYILN